MIAVTPRDAGYPPRALALEHPPDPLWIDGDPASLAARSVAIVGTRRMTAYGERVARELAGACADAGVVVVSGFAQGVDAAAHRGALDAGGRTVAVLGEGIALFLATVRGRRRPLVPRVRANGALVSQYQPNFCAQPWTFAKRNATIAALAEAVVVVEAGEVSGALITASDARRLGRPLFAVPGPIGSAASVGTNALIASGEAQALISAAVLLGRQGEPALVPSPLPVDPVLEALLSGPLDLDSLARRVRRGRAATETALATHLLDGSVVMTRDGRYRRP
ncbi:MAG TPA: DNA-processing protein DprA [Candidatus Limnocylindria bacterium]|nr:DNA-processing protein DprA [Candidatus Limnocylindria bacterium]